MDWGLPLQQNPAGGSWRRTPLHRICHLRCTPKLLQEPSFFLIYIYDFGDGIKSRVRLFTDDTILYSVIRIPINSTKLQEDIRTQESWERRWLISFNIEKCHQLTVTKKRNRIPTSYTLHNQTLVRVANAKYLGVMLTENLHLGKDIKSAAAKDNKMSAFACRNLKGCPPAVQTHYYKGLVHPVLQFNSLVCDLH